MDNITAAVACWDKLSKNGLFKDLKLKDLGNFPKKGARWFGASRVSPDATDSTATGRSYMRSQINKSELGSVSRSGVIDNNLVGSKQALKLLDEYLTMCRGEGGIRVVYEGVGQGKTCAMKVVAKNKTYVKPRRFLILNIDDGKTHEEAYDAIKKCLVGGCNYDPKELAIDLVEDLVDPQLQPTSDKYRLDIDLDLSGMNTMTKKNYGHNRSPILIIDELNLSGFSFWKQEKKDGISQEVPKEPVQIKSELGDIWKFLVTLTGASYKQGVVVLIATKSEDVTRALESINGRQKAKISGCVEGTKKDKNIQNIRSERNQKVLLPWSGFDLKREDKIELLEKIFKNKYPSCVVPDKETLGRISGENSCIRQMKVAMEELPMEFEWEEVEEKVKIE